MSELVVAQLDGGLWVVVDAQTREVVAGPFRTRAEAEAAAS